MGPDVEQPEYKSDVVVKKGVGLLQQAVIADARNATKEDLRRGAEIYASLKKRIKNADN